MIYSVFVSIAFFYFLKTNSYFKGETTNEQKPKSRNDYTFKTFFQKECESICTNEDELCDIVLDICYSKEKSKQFAWEMCGEKIIQNLLRRNNNKIHYPQLVPECGEFVYCGKQFMMCEKEVEEN